MFKLIEKTIPVITSSAFIILIIRMITKFMNPHLQPKNTQHLLPFFLSFIVALTTVETEHLLELDNNLVVQPSSNYSLGILAEPQYQEAIKINPDGSFTGTVINIRSVCNFSGKLEFLGDAKSKLFSN